jgi:hypothetical protein
MMDRLWCRARRHRLPRRMARIGVRGVLILCHVDRIVIGCAMLAKKARPRTAISSGIPPAAGTRSDAAAWSPDFLNDCSQIEGASRVQHRDDASRGKCAVSSQMEAAGATPREAATLWPR